MELSQVLSWVGTATGMFTSIPQLIKTVRTKKVEEPVADNIRPDRDYLFLSAGTDDRHQRASVYFYYAFLILVSSVQLFLIWKYKRWNVPI